MGVRVARGRAYVVMRIGISTIGYQGSDIRKPGVAQEGDTKPPQRETEVGKRKIGSRAPADHFRGRGSEEEGGGGAGGIAEAGAQGGEEAVGAGGVGTGVEEFGGNSQRAAEKVAVHAVESGEALESGLLTLEGGVAEVDLVLLSDVGGLNAFLPGEVVGEFAEACGVVGLGYAILRGLL